MALSGNWNGQALWTLSVLYNKSPLLCTWLVSSRLLYLWCCPCRNLEYLFLSDLPGVSEKETTVDRIQTSLPQLDIVLDLGWHSLYGRCGVRNHSSTAVSTHVKQEQSWEITARCIWLVHGTLFIATKKTVWEKEMLISFRYVHLGVKHYYYYSIEKYYRSIGIIKKAFMHA